MTTDVDDRRPAVEVDDQLIGWLLDSDPSLRWQVMDGLLARPA